ncbi:hypothetical protein [Chlamydiifrater phoenicopteri]|uniref:hypothetical protein n=1 Tax=Chlamydiifrater phoenicopteri TaxID=2681469 RepID=UPI001BCC3CBF|nr:hypothetical protein [Chlamydiifrater phoenicopteri]
MSALPSLSSIFRLGTRPLGGFDNFLAGLGGKAKVLGDSAGLLGDLCSAASHSSALAKHILSKDVSQRPGPGGKVPSPLGDREQVFAKVDSLLSSTALLSEGVEAVGLWGRFLTGHLFWETSSNGNFRYVSKTAYDGSVSTERSRRSFLSIAGKTAALVGRTAGFASGLHEKSLINLGAHARTLGYSAGVAFFGSAVQYSASLLEASLDIKHAKDYYQDLSAKEGFDGDVAKNTQRSVRCYLREKVICLISNILNLIALPLSVGLISGFGFVGTTVSIVICLLASILNIFRDLTE